MTEIHPLVSVIMPVYNVEHYIEEAILSVLNQTFSDFELIIIDDGSTDRSLAIARHFKEQDKRIKLFSQENRGLSATRNLGLKYSSGKYIYFFDSDDVLALNALSRCIELINQLNLDLIVFSGSAFSNNSACIESFNFYQKPNFLEPTCGTDLMVKFVQNNRYSSSVCLYLFERKIIDQNNLYFDEGYLHEDEGLTPLLFCSAQKAVSISDCLFKRRVRENSIMTSETTFKNVEGRVQGAFKIQQFIISSKDLNEEAYKVLRSLQKRLLRKAIKKVDKINSPKLLVALMYQKFANTELFKIDPAAFLYVRFHLVYIVLRLFKKFFFVL